MFIPHKKAGNFKGAIKKKYSPPLEEGNRFNIYRKGQRGFFRLHLSDKKELTFLKLSSQRKRQSPYSLFEQESVLTSMQMDDLCYFDKMVPDEGGNTRFKIYVTLDGFKEISNFHEDKMLFSNDSRISDVFLPFIQYFYITAGQFLPMLDDIEKEKRFSNGSEEHETAKRALDFLNQIMGVVDWAMDSGEIVDGEAGTFAASFKITLLRDTPPPEPERNFELVTSGEKKLPEPEKNKD